MEEGPVNISTNLIAELHMAIVKGALHVTNQDLS